MVGLWHREGEWYSDVKHRKMQDALGLRTDVAPNGYVMHVLLNILNGCVKVYSQMISLLFVFCQLEAMQVQWTRPALLWCFNDHNVHDFFKIGTLHLHGGPFWLCWLST